MIRVANNFKSTDTSRCEDYLEVINELFRTKGYASSADIAESLAVKPPSVTKMLKRLRKYGFVHYERYRGVALTSRGIQVAEKINRSHKVLTEFLESIGVESKIANDDAERIEHYLDLDTIDKIERVTKGMGN